MPRGVSKVDLLKVIKEIGWTNLRQVKELALANASESKANEALDRFMRENKEYRRLERALNKASEKRSAVYRKIEADRRMTLMELKVLINTEGPTDAVAAKVRDAAKKYLGVK